MASGLNWEKASKQDRFGRSPTHKGMRRQYALQQERSEFVREHGIQCFVCGAGPGAEWASTGTSRRGPWAICLPCAKKRSRSR